MAINFVHFLNPGQRGLLQAFTTNPLVPSGQIARDLLDEMLIAHKEHLPQFKERIEKLEEKNCVIV